jgi:hypothetical protein
MLANKVKHKIKNNAPRGFRSITGLIGGVVSKAEVGFSEMATPSHVYHQHLLSAREAWKKSSLLQGL